MAAFSCLQNVSISTNKNNWGGGGKVEPCLCIDLLVGQELNLSYFNWTFICICHD